MGGQDAQRPLNSRFAQRILPVDISTHPKISEFEAMVATTLAPYVGRTWRLEFEQFHGGWNTISQAQALAACRGVLTGEHFSATNPEVTVLCTLHPRFVGL